jgi:hypothetical protein
MSELRYTLVTDGSSDRTLIPILTWILQANGIELAIQSYWADLRQLPIPPKPLPEKINTSLDLYPCDLLFVHRDAERESHKSRKQEVVDALDHLHDKPPAICVIPVKMQEAWLLIDETAIRVGAGNPNGRVAVSLPKVNKLEQLPDPKGLLYKLLREASDLRGRRLHNFKANQAVYRVAQAINDFSPLRNLDAFAELEADVQKLIDEQGWNNY